MGLSPRRVPMRPPGPHRRCCECGASLSHQYYEKDGRLYCKKDYWARFGELCHGCAEQITKGLVMVRLRGRSPTVLSLRVGPRGHPGVPHCAGRRPGVAPEGASC